jgi:leucyl-tRNA synthetase
MKYNPVESETKWQKRWEDERVYHLNLEDAARKLYCLVMFIYPSADKLHIGHWFNYAPTDTWARFKKLQGFRVFEPMGYDAFGLPAENAAVKTGIHPAESTKANIEDIRQQLKRIGAMYDWDYEIDTSAPEYYKWTQWLFLQLFKMKKAYRATAPVNWCPNDKTVLANEQVIDGFCERCGTQVIKRDLTQWFFKITDYADELLEKLETLDWPEKTKLMQRNWIGKSRGIEIEFRIDGSDKSFKVFTTRPDTLFGVTYAVLAPEHPLVMDITTDQNKASVESYIEQTRLESEIDRQSLDREKTGVSTGAYAINPVNNEKVPIWIADYVLFTYGTGAVMAVPGHDERDFEFAKKFDLEIRKVILQSGTRETDPLDNAYTDTGVMINSGQYDGLDSDVGIEKISDALEEEGIGKRKINYRLRDWLVSRQRYWGAPIPIIHCPACGEVPVPEDQLPVLLPRDVDFLPGGESPLARCREYIDTKCPKCGGKAQRDADTMDTFVCSSWYYLRFPNPRLSDKPFDVELMKKWLPVDKYVGGAEHAVMHLLYARFITKVLRDAGYLQFDEPFLSLVHQGTITNSGAKMSKSRGNVINPDQFINTYGSDIFRMYLMFMGPYEEGGDWSDTGIVGIDRFVKRLYHLVNEKKNESGMYRSHDTPLSIDAFEGEARNLYRKTQLTIKKVTEDTEKFQFNTAIAAMMELLNEIGKFLHPSVFRSEPEMQLGLRSLLDLVLLLSPYAPHTAEELWETVGNKAGVFEVGKWPSYDPRALAAEEITVVGQINGKIRSRILVAAGLPEDTLKQIVMNDDPMKKHLDGRQIVKIIVVPNKLVNVVVR